MTSKNIIISTAVSAVLLSAIAPVAMADSVPACSVTDCTWEILVGGQDVDSGTYSESPSGVLNFKGPLNWSGNGTSVNLNLSGDADPVLGFSFSATTTTSANSFALSLSMPISLVGPISASSSASYTLTATSSAGATVGPLSTHLVTAQNVSSVGATPPFNLGVDVGNTFSVQGGPVTQNSPVYSATSLYSLAANAYDLTTVTLGFSLTANSNVGVSGFVEQTPVPLPAAAWLLLSGAVALSSRASRRTRV